MISLFLPWFNGAFLESSLETTELSCHMKASSKLQFFQKGHIFKHTQKIAQVVERLELPDLSDLEQSID